MNSVVEYLLAQNAYRNYLQQKMLQVTIPFFLQMSQVSLVISPGQPSVAWIIYKVIFGEAMVPHQFSTKISQQGSMIFDAIVSGSHIGQPFETFSLYQRSASLSIYITNLRNTTGYFESTISYLEAPIDNRYQKLLEDIARLGVAPPAVGG
jgi:hypothetical protein